MAGLPPQQLQAPGAGRGRGMTLPAWMKGPSPPAAPPTSGPPQVHLSGNAPASGPVPPPRMPGLGPSGAPPPNYGGVPPMQFRPTGPPPPGQPFLPPGVQPYRPPGPVPGMGPQMGLAPGMQGMAPQGMPSTSQPLQYSAAPMQQMPQRPPQQAQPVSSQGMALPFSQQPRPMPSGPPQQQPQQLSMPPVPTNAGIPPPSSFGFASTPYPQVPSSFGMASAPYQNSLQPPIVQPLQAANQPWAVVPNQTVSSVAPQTMQVAAQAPPALTPSPAAPTGITASPNVLGGSDWQEFIDKEGRRFYFNKRLNRSSWEKPVELMTTLERADVTTGWKEVTSGDGRKFYYNRSTGKSTWKMPGDMKTARAQVEKSSMGTSPVPASDGLVSTSAPAVSTPAAATVSTSGSPSPAVIMSSVSPMPVFHVPQVVSPAVQPMQMMSAGVPSVTSALTTPPQFVTAAETSKEETVTKNSKDAADEASAQDLEEAKKAMLLAGKINVTPVAEEKPSPVLDEPVTYASKLEAKNAFKELLESVHVESDWTWDQTMRVIINDKRYGALKTLGERKQAFNEYLAQRKKLETEEKRLKQKKAREDFLAMLEECKELTSSMRWSKAVSLFEDDARYLAVEKDREREELFEDYLVDLDRKEREKAREERKTNLAEYRSFLETCDFIKANSQWRKVQDKLEDDERCARLDKIDRLTVFQEYIRDLEKEEEEEKKIQKEQMRRKERKNRDDFRHLLDEHKVAGLLNARTVWRNYMSKVKEHTAYQTVASNTSGSTPKELFEDFVEELEKQYHEDKSKAKDAIKAGKIVVLSTWSYDKFKAAIAEAGDLAAIAEPNLKLIFEDLLERAKEKDEKEAKKTRRMAEEFTDLLRSTKVMNADSKWEESRSLLEDASEYRAITDESLRKKLFDEYITHLQQKAKDKERKREKEDKARKEREKEKEKERERRKEKDREKEKEKEKKREKESHNDAGEVANNHTQKEEKKKDKDREKDRDREREKKHRKRHRSSSEDVLSEKDDKEGSKKSRRHGSDSKKSSRKHVHESGSDSETKHRRHRRDRDGTRRNGAAEELEDGELGEDGEIR